MMTRTLGYLCAAGLLWACGANPELTSEEPGPSTGGGGGNPSAVDSGAVQPRPLDAGSMAEPAAPITSRPKGDGGTTFCESYNVPSTRVIPDMLIVLDRSGSMNPDGNDRNTDRWGGSVEAIIDVTGTLDDKIHFGLMTFPAFTMRADGDDDDDNECAAGTVNVPIAKDTGPAIAMSLNGMDADGRTPTAASLQAALKVVNQPAPGDTAVPKRYVLLVTDGDPNCSGSQQQRGPDTAARQQSIAAIQALAMVDIKTFVVGYQTAGTEFEQQLDMMAAAGATGEMKHRSVESGADLAKVFEQLAGEVASCSFELAEAVEDSRYVKVTVAKKGRTLGNATDGWTLSADNKTVELTGAACDEVRAGAPFDVNVECSEVPIF